MSYRPSASAASAASATGSFRRDLPRHWLITTACSLMHAAAEDVAVSRVTADDAAGLITGTLARLLHPACDTDTLGRQVADAIARQLPEAGSLTWTSRAAPR